jgi:hypothetical protein
MEEFGKSTDLVIFLLSKSSFNDVVEVVQNLLHVWF